MIFLPVLLMLTTFFYFSAVELKDYHVIIIFFIFVCLSYNYFINRTYIYSQLVDENFTSSAAYSVLYFTPIVLSINIKWIRALVIITTTIVLLLSFKRTGILAFFVAMFLYLLIINKNKIDKYKNINVFVYMVIGIILLGYIMHDFDSKFVVERFEDLSTDGGSGRVYIYNKIINLIYNSDIISILFGHGWDAVSRVNGMPAHNDFLEIIYDFGFIVFIIYVSFVCKLFKYTYKLYKLNNEFIGPMVVSLVIFVVNSMFSHILLYPEYMYPFALFWGGVCGINRHNQYI